MKVFSVGMFVSMPFYQVADGGGSGGAGDTGAGGAGSGGTGGNVVTPDAAGGADEPLEIDENRLIRVKGQDKPIKFSEYGRNFQSQFTKVSQRAAQLQKDLESERQARQQYEQQVRQAAQVPQAGGNDVFSQLEALPYLNGQQAAAVVRSIAEQIGQRDQVLLATLKQLQQMQGIVQSLHGERQGTAFDAKIANFVKDAGYPAEITQWAKELYLAYEGDDLDDEFPGILKERYEGFNRAMDAQRAAKVRQARDGKMFVPGKGGNTGPTKPFQIKANASPAEIADALFPPGGFGSDDET